MSGLVSNEFYNCVTHPQKLKFILYFIKCEPFKHENSYLCLHGVIFLFFTLQQIHVTFIDKTASWY